MKQHKIEKAVCRTLAIAVCLLSTVVFAEEKAAVAEPFKLGDYEFKADPELGYQYVTTDHRSAKANEYRDLESGIEFSAKAKMFRDSYYMGLGIKNAGKTNQEYNLTGGQYDKFKYKVYFGQLVHNTSFDAHTFYTGAGTSQLTYTDHPYYGPTATAKNATTGNDVPGVAGWAGWTNTFDYGLKRKSYGATGALSLAAPFFVDFGVDRTLTTGTKVAGSTSNLELPVPVDYVNNSGFVEAAYRKDNIAASARYDVSNFLTKDNYLYYQSWKLPAADLTKQDLVDHISLAPSSLMTKVSVDAVVKDLPLESTLSFHGGLTKMTDNVTLDPTPATNAKPADTLSAAVFAGNVQYRKADLSFVSRPIDKLDTRAYLGYFQNYNTSNIVSNLTSANAVTFTNSLYNYHKSNGGLDAGYRLPMDSKVKAGYQYVTMFRPEREDALSSHDHNFNLKLSNGYFDWMDASVKAEVLSRTTEYEGMAPGVTAGSPTTHLNEFVRPYDAASKLMWKFTAETDFAPVDNLALDLSYSQRKNNYRNTRIGKTADLTHEGFVDAGYSFKNGLHLNGFMDVEKTTSDSRHRFVGTNMEGSPEVGDVSPTTNPMAINWDAKETGTTYGYGLMADYPVMPNFTLGLSFVQDASSGSRAFTLDPVVQAIIQMQDLGNLDKMRHSMVNLKGTYAINSKFSASVGFMFDKLVYEDDGWANYEFKTEPKATTGTGAQSAGFFFTGFGADNSYISRVTYVSLTYNL